MLCEECQRGQKLLEEINEEIYILKQFPSGKSRMNSLIRQGYQIQQEMAECECNKDND